MSRNYEGRQVAQIKWPGMQTEMLNSRTTTLSDDMLAFIDQMDRSLIRVYDPLSGKPLQDIRLKAEAVQISLSQTEAAGPGERMLAIVDRNGDLYLVMVRRVGRLEHPKKLGMMIQSLIWHHEAPLLAVVRDSKLRVFYFPQVLFVDESLLDNTWEDKDLG
jgi:intraflagellar transport protein 80